MIIKSLTVQHWGGIYTGVCIGEFSEGFNIIYGPNGSGKSTIMDALARGLFDRHRVQSPEIRDKQPLGSDMYPEVVVEFLQDGKQYRIKKKFLSKQYSELWHTVNGNWEPLAEGDNADERLLRLLDSDRMDRGTTQPKHWGIAQLLWLPQGQVWFSEGLNAKSRNRLQNVLGNIIITPTFHNIEGQVKGFYDKLYTDVRAELRARSEPKELEKELEDAQEKLADLKQRWDSLDELNQEILSLRAEYGDTDKSLRQEQARLENAEADLKEAQKRTNERKLAEAEVKTKESLWRAINDRVRELKGVRDKLKELLAEETEQEKAKQNYDSEVRKAEEDIKGAEEFIRVMKEQRNAAENKANIAQAQIDLFAREKIYQIS